MELHELLIEAIKQKSSDIHITVGVEPTLRINGSLTKIGDQKADQNLIDDMIEELLDEEKMKRFKSNGEIDLSFHLDAGEFDHRFRVNVFNQRGSTAASFRLIPHKIPKFDNLGLPHEVRDIALRPRGLFLVTGPTGSGKSTTLASMIDIVNEKLDKHIITLEDPIEYVHRHKKCIINQRSVGNDTKSFANGLRAALRQDPDIILVGEIRDLETMETAITAAETGHLVLATLHTNNAAETIERVIDVFPAHQHSQVRTQLALTLQGVLSQQLIPNINRDGRVIATELLLVNSAVRNLIREGKSHQIPSVLQTNRQQGMHSMDYSLRDLFFKGLISREDALNRAIDIKALESMI